METAIGCQPFTPQYASPEQVCGGILTTATDVYSLGALCYELLTGACPREITSGDPGELVRVVCQRDVPRPSSIARDFDRDLEAVIEKAMRKQSDRRYASVELFAADIARFLEGQSVLARPETLAYRVSRFVRRHVALEITSLALLTLVVAFAVHVYNRETSTPQPEVTPLTSLPGTKAGSNLLLASALIASPGSQTIIVWR